MFSVTGLGAVISRATDAGQFRGTAGRDGGDLGDGGNGESAAVAKVIRPRRDEV